MSYTIMAKPHESLTEHIDNCLAVWQALWAARRAVYSTWAMRAGLTGDEFYQLVTEMIKAHDLGKGSYPWQQYITQSGRRITHSLFSFLLYGETKGWSTEGAHLAALLAVLAHHQMLHDQAFSGPQIKSLGTVKFYALELEDFARQYLKGEDVKFRDSYTGEYAAKRVLMTRIRLSKLELFKHSPLKFKSIFTMFLSILTYVDHEASRNGTSFNMSSEEIWQGFSQSPVMQSPNELQRSVRERVQVGAENLLLQAGCGVGKTGAALTAGYELILQGRIDKVIFTLPTKFTTNSLYWDFMEKYGFRQEDIGIYHSEIESVLVQNPSEDDEDDNQFQIEKRLNCWYARALNVSTIDHLLYSLLHCYKYADRAFGHLQTAMVVFDELHYYDHLLLAKIGECLKLLRNLKIPHVIMSATLPAALIHELQDRAALENKNYTCIEDASTMDSVPCNIQLLDSSLCTKQKVNELFLELIAWHKELKQMVVVNQVERAKALTRKLREILPGSNIICYHSEFTRIDRSSKEKLIKILFKKRENRYPEEIEFLTKQGLANTDQVILVSTQICELSLDISAQVMHSEIAPLDSLVQRAGRLHRKGWRPQVKECGCPQCQSCVMPSDFTYTLFVYPLDWEDKNALLPYVTPGQPNILRESWSILEANERIIKGTLIRDWINALYPTSVSLTDYNMYNLMVEDAVFGKTPKERFGQEEEENSQGSFKVRENIQPSLVVVPAIYAQNEQEPEELLKNWGIRVGKNKVFKHRAYLHESQNGVYILDIPYDKELGFHFLP